jgi:RNA polymerase sigma-70 factor, ECF subfamily
VRRFRRGAVAAQDLEQELLSRLFVAEPGRAPKIAEYRGEGRLGQWLRVTAVRTFLNAERHARVEGPSSGSEDPALLVWEGGDDPELAFLKARYRDAFKGAFEAAVAALPDRQRNLLWHRSVAQHTVDQIAAIYHVHRSTAARQVDQAREALLAGTRAALMERLSVDRSELDSILHLIASHVDVTLSRVLRRPGRAAHRETP